MHWGKYLTTTRLLDQEMFRVDSTAPYWGRSFKESLFSDGCPVLYTGALDVIGSARSQSGT